MVLSSQLTGQAVHMRDNYMDRKCRQSPAFRCNACLGMVDTVPIPGWAMGDTQGHTHRRT